LQIRIQLSGVLKAVISQRLLPKIDGVGVIPAAEILVSTARIRECIVDETRTQEVRDAIADGTVAYGMQTFDQSLMALVKEAKVSYHEALRNSTNPNDFALRMKGIRGTSDGKWEQFEGEGAQAEEPSDAFSKTTIFQEGKYRDAE
ncbi:MAG: type IV pili twitching motility protein PilT, partial [Desulfomonilia bacterium]|nr:type IV pili twitching motility protein PilT [Desulfomonilia bacterium]